MYLREGSKVSGVRHVEQRKMTGNKAAEAQSQQEVSHAEAMLVPIL